MTSQADGKGDSGNSTKEHAASKDHQKKAAAVVVVVCLVVVAAIFFVFNGDTLSVHSEVQSMPADEGHEQGLTPVPNSPPEILSLTPASDRIAPFDLCEIVCEAVDPDGDDLTYTWTASQGDIYGEGSTIEWGSPVNEGLFRITVSVDDGRGGVSEFSTSLRVKANTDPEILTLSTDVDWVVPGTSVYLSCAAQDADGDELTYMWEATGGEFFGSGKAVVWLAPEEEGSYWLTVRVRDAYGGESLRAIPISVTYGEPPSLGEFIVKGVNTDMVRPTGDAWKIFRGRTLTVTCVVEKGDGPFTYEWSVDRGKLTSDGETATWEAPDTRVSATIVVDVTDVHGNTTSGSLFTFPSFSRY